MLKSNEDKLNYLQDKNCYLQKHHKKCEKIFDGIIKGTKLFIHFNYCNADSQYCRIDVLTEDMCKYDNYVFNELINREEKLKNSYRPYFASFLFDKKVNQYYENDDSAWYEGKFVNENEEFHTEQRVFIGILELSASPVNYLKGCLIVSNTKNAKIDQIVNSTYKNSISNIPATHEDIEKKLKKSWTDFVNDRINTIDIYNLGHGNADYIRGNKGRILYDIGYSYKKYPNKNVNDDPHRRAVTAIRYLKPSCVVLSHWDMDHILGCAYADQSIFDADWIAPQLFSSAGNQNRVSINAIRIAKYLDLLHKLSLVDRKSSDKKIAELSIGSNTQCKSKFTIWLGDLGKNDSRITENNREGLVIEISTPKLHALLCGDVPYSCIPSSIFNDQIDYLHVPHHGSAMNLDSLSKQINNGCTGNTAIISNDICQNVACNHMKELNNKFSEVLLTEYPCQCYPNSMVSTTLSVQIDCDSNSIIIR